MIVMVSSQVSPKHFYQAAAAHSECSCFISLQYLDHFTGSQYANE